jgi:hypothetical protein
MSCCYTMRRTLFGDHCSREFVVSRRESFRVSKTRPISVCIRIISSDLNAGKPERDLEPALFYEPEHQPWWGWRSALGGSGAFARRVVQLSLRPNGGCDRSHTCGRRRKTSEVRHCATTKVERLPDAAPSISSCRPSQTFGPLKRRSIELARSCASRWHR